MFFPTRLWEWLAVKEDFAGFSVSETLWTLRWHLVLQGRCLSDGAWFVCKIPITMKTLVDAFGCIGCPPLVSAEKISSELKVAEITEDSAFAFSFLKRCLSMTVFPSRIISIHSIPFVHRPLVTPGTRYHRRNVGLCHCSQLACLHPLHPLHWE